MKSVVPPLLILMTGLSLSAQPSAYSYVCPPCDNACDAAAYEEPGVCPHCNMVLVRADLSRTIAFYLQDGVEILDFAGPMEVFSYAGYEVFTVSKNRGPIKSQGILTVLPDHSLQEAPPADILAFFGGNAGEAYRDPDLISWIEKQQVAYHFSVCTGAFMLAEAGLLNGQTATTFHSALDDLEENYPEVDVRRDVRFVDNGRIITTAGISAGIDGALHLVAKLQGYNAARRVAYHMEYDRWEPGDGLLLTSENPYQESLSEEGLRQFEGLYEHERGQPVKIYYSERDRGLFGAMGQTSLPLFHEKGDVFSDLQSRPVFFIRNSDGDIVGYRRRPEGELFRKLPASDIDP